MKKTLLITAVVFCFIATVSAQTLEKIEKFNLQTREYKEKLDSVVSGDHKYIMQYDDKFNLTSCTSYGYYNGNWMIYEIVEYRYDAQNRLVSATWNYSGDINRISFQYNENGLVSEKAYDYYSNGQWNYVSKYVYHYDSQGLLEVITSYVIYEDEWSPNTVYEYCYADGLLDVVNIYYPQPQEESSEPAWELIERYLYNYNDRRLCISKDDELLYFIDDADVWILNEKEEYGYDEHDNRISSISSYYDEDGNLESYYWRSEHVFDDHHNCISSNSYEHDGTQWVLYGHGDLTYDLSANTENIAGFELYWEDDAVVVTNKLTEASWNYSDGDNWTNKYYYSKCTGVGEQFGNQLLCWPNPVQETLNIPIDGLRQILIFNMEGKKVLEDNSHSETIHVGTLPKGCYLLKATLKDGSVSTQKFMKQ